MTTPTIANGIAHKVPEDMKQVLLSSVDLRDTWNNLTDIARNEWICWVTIVKKEETRIQHIVRMQEDLLRGKKRPCCWPGCPHRNPNAKKWIQ